MIFQYLVYFLATFSRGISSDPDRANSISSHFQCSHLPTSWIRPPTTLTPTLHQMTTQQSLFLPGANLELRLREAAFTYQSKCYLPRPLQTSLRPSFDSASLLASCLLATNYYLRQSCLLGRPHWLKLFARALNRHDLFHCLIGLRLAAYSHVPLLLWLVRKCLCSWYPQRFSSWYFGCQLQAFLAINPR